MEIIVVERKEEPGPTHVGLEYWKTDLELHSFFLGHGLRKCSQKPVLLY